MTVMIIFLRPTYGDSSFDLLKGQDSKLSGYGDNNGNRMDEI